MCDSFYDALVSHGGFRFHPSLVAVLRRLRILAARGRQSSVFNSCGSFAIVQTK